MRTWGELRAMTLLVLRSWYRMGPRLRGGRKPEPTRGVSAVLMRLVFAALIYNFGFSASLLLAREQHPTWIATWAALGAGGFVLAVTLAMELPSPRMPTQAFKSELLEMLPISPLAKLVLTLGQAGLALPLGLGLALSIRSEMDSSTSVVAAVVLGLLHFVWFALAGACLGKLLKRTLSPYRASRLGWLSAIPWLGGMLLLQHGPSRWLGRPPAWLGDGLGLALIGVDVWRTNAIFALTLLVLAGAFVVLERAHELSEPVRAEPTSSAFGSGADMRRLERVLTRREPGGSFQVPFGAIFSAALVGFLTWASNGHFVSRPRELWNVAVIIVLQLVSTLGMQRATRSVSRDMLARPLLGALPIRPSDTLAAKASILRRSLLTVAAPLVLVLGAGYWHRAWLPELSWRVAATLVTVGIYGSAATYVAFLTAGLGSARPRGGALGSLESFLLAIPFASVLFAPGPGSALLSMLSLAALAFEARRAALQTIDWLDDAEQEHATEVWRALVIFGGFQGAQLLTLQLASLFGEALSPTARMLAAYVVAALALWVMTLREQEHTQPSHRARRAPLGLVVGACSGAFAWLYLHLVHPTSGSVAQLEMTSAFELALAALAIVGVAPIVEERFFRGWLQLALERALGKRAIWAPVLTGLAFAAAHPAYSFVPVLVLGVLNGFLMLRFRSLSACMVAHAVHNALALYFGSSS